MTTLENRPNIALLVVDVQNGVVGGAHERDAVVANIGELVDKARQQRVPVIWVQHSDENVVRDSDNWRIVTELSPGEAEPLVEKSYADAFEATTLETVLSGLGVGRLIVAGAQTDECIRGTLHGAIARGYDATLVSDAHTTEDQSGWGAPTPDMVIAHTNLYWTNHRAPGRHGPHSADKAGHVRPRTISRLRRALTRRGRPRWWRWSWSSKATAAVERIGGDLAAHETLRNTILPTY